jgi:hypothetical protein
MKRISILALSVLLIAGCQYKPVTASLSSLSPDGKTNISINAKKEAALDPFTVTLSVKTGGADEGSLQFEIAAKEIKETNVKFKWTDSNNCRITFVQSDGGERVFAYYATASNVVVKEIKNE